MLLRYTSIALCEPLHFPTETTEKALEVNRPVSMAAAIDISLFTYLKAQNEMEQLPSHVL